MKAQQNRALILEGMLTYCEGIISELFHKVYLKSKENVRIFFSFWNWTDHSQVHIEKYTREGSCATFEEPGE